MKERNLQDVKKKNLFEDRTVMMCVVTVSVFLYFFTVFELLTLKAETGVSAEIETTELAEVTEIVDETEREEVIAATEKIENTEDAEDIDSTEIPEENREASVEEDPFPYYLKIKFLKIYKHVYSLLDLNQRPTDYESVATNQLS